MALPSLAGTLTIWRAAATKAAAELRRFAAENPEHPAAKTAVEAAGDIEAALSAISVLDITSTVMDELKALALSGRGIVHHAATDTF